MLEIDGGKDTRGNGDSGSGGDQGESSGSGGDQGESSGSDAGITIETVETEITTTRTDVMKRVKHT